MIDYKLARELKEAGFPQRGKGGHYKPPREERYIAPALSDFAEPQMGDLLYRPPKHLSYVYDPTLSELIGACGEEFGTLMRFTTEWEAWCSPNKDGKEFCRRGKTPEIAVANLYLALKKKDT